jgi:hypothetical protein
LNRAGFALLGAAVIAMAMMADRGLAAPVTLIGTGNASLQHNGTTRFDITDPNGDNRIDTTEWGTAPTVTNSSLAVGTFNPTNNGENWAKLFDNFIGGPGPWGTSTSKVCCDFTPGATSLTMKSAKFAYSLTGYTIANGNDTEARRPTGWRLYGSNDNFATTGALLDTVTAADINGGAGWTAHNQVGAVTFATPTASYSSYRIIFDNSVSPNAFQVGEVELLGLKFDVGGDNRIAAIAPENVATITGGARFLRVSERAGTDSKFHIGEIEAFELGVTPDGAGPAPINGPNLSTNDILATGYHSATTTSSLEHGNPTTVYNGALESQGAVWSTALDLTSPDPRYTLDLGKLYSIQSVRVYPRDEGCCTDRFANLRVEAFADDGTGNPGTLMAALDGPDNAPGGTTAVLDLPLNVPMSATVFAQLSKATYVFEIDALTNTADMLALPNPNPVVYDTTLDLNGAGLAVEFINGIPQPGTYQLFQAEVLQGQLGEISLPALTVPATWWDTSRLLVDGTLTLAAPEPSTGLMALVFALGGCLIWRRR